MFIGSMPTQVIGQMFKSIDFTPWSDVFVMCSGSFRIEQAFRALRPMIDVHGNDISLLTCSIGRLAVRDPVAISFHNELQWLEDALADAEPIDRAAAVLLLTDVVQYLSGKTNIYKQKHVDEIRRRLPGLIQAGRSKIEALLGSINLETFFAGDLRVHMRTAIERGSGVVSFPPTYKGGYEAMYRFIDKNVTWDAPSYDVFDPNTLRDIMVELSDAGVPWVLGCDQEIEGFEPIGEFVPGRNKPILTYASDGRASYHRRASGRIDPFKFEPIDLARIHAGSNVELVEVDGAKAAYVKDLYLAKGIIHTSGMANYLVMIDGMLAGLMVYALSTRKAYHKNEVYLLSDLATSRDAKLSKLIARLAAGAGVMKRLQTRFVTRFEYVVTTAFAKAPVSMKYRGVFELLKRTEDGKGGFLLNYGSAVRDETPQQALTWWWNSYGKKELGRSDARNRGQAGRPEGAAGAGSQRAIHDRAANEATHGQHPA